jgi:selenocysteine lyase/cysteine desulfurase
MTHVSNVTGSIFDIRAVGKIARDAGALFFLDAAQSAGVLDIDVQRDNIDMLAFTAHKYLFALQGLGGLYVREGIGLKPLIVGGGTGNSLELDPKLEMPDILEAGTQNLPGIAALQKAIEFVESNHDKIRKKEAELTEYFLQRMEEIPFLKLLGRQNSDGRVSLFSLVSDEYPVQDIAGFLEDRYGIVVRTGVQCAPLIHRYIGSEKEGTFRVSLSYFNEKEEIDVLVKGLQEFPACGGTG